MFSFSNSILCLMGHTKLVDVPMSLAEAFHTLVPAEIYPMALEFVRNIVV